MENLPPRETTSPQSPVIRYLWIAVAGLAALLLVSIIVKSSSRDDGGGTTVVSEADLKAMQAEIEARRAVVNRNRADYNQPPLPSQGQALDDITARMRRDADTLISLIERSQELIAAKDRQITGKNVELIRSEQRRQALAVELADLRHDTADTTRMRDELAAAVARGERLAGELADAREQLAELTENPPPDELDVMKRRLDEATRARDFFEERANELESRLRQRSNNGSTGGLPEGP